MDDLAPAPSFALDGSAPLSAADTHVALLLAGTEELAWEVTSRVTQELHRRALARSDPASPERREQAEMLGMLVEAAALLDRAPTMDEFDIEARKRGWPLASKIARRFGGWPAALAKAGLLAGPVAVGALNKRRGRRQAVARRIPIPEERLIEVLRWCARVVHDGEHRYVSVREFLDWRELAALDAANRGIKLHLPSCGPYRERYGGWTQAARKAGLSHVPAAPAKPRPRAQ